MYKKQSLIFPSIQIENCALAVFSSLFRLYIVFLFYLSDAWRENENNLSVCVIVLWFSRLLLFPFGFVSMAFLSFSCFLYMKIKISFYVIYINAQCSSEKPWKNSIEWHFFYCAFNVPFSFYVFFLFASFISVNAIKSIVSIVLHTAHNHLYYLTIYYIWHHEKRLNKLCFHSKK